MSKATHQRAASWIIGVILLAFLFGVYLGNNDPLPEHKQRLLGVFCALLAALFAYFMSGQLSLRVTGQISRSIRFVLRATGGMALFAIILLWWLSPYAPIKVDITPAMVVAFEKALEPTFLTRMEAESLTIVPNEIIESEILLRALGANDPYLQALALIADEKNEEARERLTTAEEYVRGNQTTDLAKIYVARARSYLYDYRLQDAHTWYEKARSLNPDDLRIAKELGEVLLALGEPQSALEILTHVFASAQTEWGSRHLDTLDVMKSIFHSYYALGQNKDAERIAEDEYIRRKEVQGDAHNDTITVQANLALLKIDNGQFESAETELKSILEQWDSLYGQVRLRALDVMNNLAMLYRQKKDTVQAEALYRKSLEYRLLFQRRDHPDVLVTKSNLALLLIDEKRFPEALAIFEEILPSQISQLGMRHPSVLTTTNNLGLLYYQMKKYGKAASYFEQALPALIDSVGEKHSDTLMCMSNLSGAYKELGNYERAIELSMDSVRVQKEVLGVKHKDTLIGLFNLADLQMRLDRYDDAVLNLELAIAGARITFPPGFWLTGAIISKYGKCLLHVERADEALTAALEGYEFVVAALGSEHIRTQIAAEILADIYDARGDSESAKQYRALAARLNEQKDD